MGYLELGYKILTILLQWIYSYYECFWIYFVINNMEIIFLELDLVRFRNHYHSFFYLENLTSSCQVLRGYNNDIRNKINIRVSMILKWYAHLLYKSISIVLFENCTLCCNHFWLFKSMFVSTIYLHLSLFLNSICHWWNNFSL